MKKLILFLCIGFFPLLGEEKKREITISYLEGDVDVFLSGKKDWEKAKLYGKLKEGDRIRTKLQSKAELTLPNKSTIKMDENSIMDIKEIFQKGLTEKFSFKLWIGNVKAKFERLRTKDSEARFYTPTAVMGLRGTEVWLIVDWEGKTRAFFEKGRGYIYSDKEGEKPVNEGEEAEVSLEGEIRIKKQEMKSVPNVIGKSLLDAKNDIISAGLRIGEVRAEKSISPPDTVLSQYPLAGEKVLPNTYVSLSIASPIPPCIVPDVIGLLKEEAEAKIALSKLILGVVIEIESDRPKGEVLRQRPIGGTEVKENSRVDIVVSKGPAPKVIVPNLIGETIENARRILENVGLKLSGIILKKESTTIEEGKIVEQKPIAGESVGVGSFVQVWIAALPIAEKPPIPTISYRWSLPSFFVNEVPSLLLTVGPPDEKWAPLFIQIMGRLTKLNKPPYILSFKPPFLNIGINNIDVSCWFEDGASTSKVIPSPYYDPLPPKIINVKLKRIEGGVKVIVVVEDNESGINYVRINGENAIPEDTIEKRIGERDVYIRGSYERIISIPKTTTPTIFINIETEDNAGNRRERREGVPDIPIPPPPPSE